MKHAVSRYRAPFVTGFPFPLVTGPGVDAADTCTDTRFWLGVREVFPVAVAKSGRAALSRCKVFIGNFVLPPRVSTVLPGQLPSIRTGTSYRPPAADRILSAPLVYRLVSLKKTHSTDTPSTQIQCQRYSYGKNTPHESRPAPALARSGSSVSPVAAERTSVPN